VYLDEEKRRSEERRDAADTKLLEQLKATSSGDLGPGIAPQVIIDTFEEEEPKAVLKEIITKLSSCSIRRSRGVPPTSKSSLGSASSRLWLGYAGRFLRMT